MTVVGRERAPQEDRLGRGAAEWIAGWLRDLDIELVAETTGTADPDPG